MVQNSFDPKGPMDETDRQLLVELSANGRLSYEDLGGMVGLSSAATRKRVNRLLEADHFRIVGVVHPRVFGLHCFAHLSVRTSGPARPVAERLALNVEVPFVSLSSGWTSIVAEFRTPSVDGLIRQISLLRDQPGVAGIELTLYRELVKDSGFVVRDTQAVQVDAIDRRLLAELQLDGRSSFAELARSVDLSFNATRARVRALLDQGMVQVGLRSHPGSGGEQHHLGFGLSISEAGSSVLAELSAMSHVYFLASAVGTFDAIGTLVGASVNETIDLCEQIRALAGVEEVVTWSHLQYVKETHIPPKPPTM